MTRGLYSLAPTAQRLLKQVLSLDRKVILPSFKKIKPGKGTGLHHHNDVDEIFYVIDGTGTAVLGTKSYDIEAGDFIFIPKNLDHKIRKYDSAGILKVVFFMDKPGLLEFFKERHKQFYIDKKTMTLEELNKVAEKYGTHFKTLD